MNNNMRNFDTPNPITAILDIPAGRVQLIATDQTDTTVRIQPANAAKNRDVKAAQRTTVDYHDGVLRITDPTSKNKLVGSSGSIEVTIELPAGSRIDAKTACCEVRSVGRLGDVTFDGAYRQISIDEAASLHLTAIDGDVEIGRLGGPAQISTARGDIRITEAAAGAVVLRTHSGDIAVTAATGVSATLDAGTGYGRIDNALRNDGDARLDIRATTSHGHITARSR
ncbi:Putative adhesin [Asanoa ishikariensis]|uniref:Putative adhesin n=1 Tax=Asanoa ishikariensis TaxID=137265 RepID=A0A1H3REU5_9ACTN|nr:Putative adhesin [Asanoa ishikariensis]